MHETPQKCELILRQMLEIVNSGKSITLEEDFGNNTLTISIKDQGHTHVGVPDGGFDILVNHLHDLLLEGRGLSWA